MDVDDLEHPLLKFHRGEQTPCRDAFRIVEVRPVADPGIEGHHMHLGQTVGGAKPPFQPAAVPLEQRKTALS